MGAGKTGGRQSFCASAKGGPASGPCATLDNRCGDPGDDLSDGAPMPHHHRKELRVLADEQRKNRTSLAMVAVVVLIAVALVVFRIMAD